MTDFIWEALKILVAVLLGVGGKVLYDRFFAKGPDLRYEFQRAANFGVGDKETVYQNLVVTNQGTDTAEDVRISFKRPGLDLVEYQLEFDGPHDKEQTDDRAVVILKTLPPNDLATLSFIFSPAKTHEKIEDLLVSVRASQCLGKPRSSSTTTNSESTAVMALIWGGVLGLLITWMVIFLLRTLTSSTLIPPVTVATFPDLGPAVANSTEEKLVELKVQAPGTINRGKSVKIEFFIENLSQDPFIGFLDVHAPYWGTEEMQYSDTRLDQSITVAAGKRELITWTFKVPKGAVPGRYALIAKISGRAYDKYIDLRKTVDLKVN